MSVRVIDRLWLVAGVLGAAILLAVGWFFFIKPMNDEANVFKEQVSVEEDRLRVLEVRLAALRTQNDRKQDYIDERKAYRLALPRQQHELSRFLVELQEAGNAVNVNVTSVTVGVAISLTVASADVRSLPITLTAAGQQRDVYRFLDQIQLAQPRAVLINSVSVAPDGTDSELGKAVLVNINLDTFVTIPPGSSGGAEGTKD